LGVEVSKTIDHRTKRKKLRAAVPSKLDRVLTEHLKRERDAMARSIMARDRWVGVETDVVRRVLVEESASSMRLAKECGL